MSVCPTCGRHTDDELVHSTLLPGEARADEQWHRDLGALISVLRRLLDDEDRRVRRIESAAGRLGNDRKRQLRSVA